MSRSTLDVPFDTTDFALRPDETVEDSYRHLSRRRRLLLGAGLTVVFEDRHTLWFRIQELIRYAQYAPGDPIQKQFDWYQQLIPGNGRLLAAVWISSRAPNADELSDAIAGGRIVLRSDAGHEIEGLYLNQSVSDRTMGRMLWAEFVFDEHERMALHEPYIGWELGIEAEDEREWSCRLPESMIDSLSSDVE